jgi:hypothetical protein
MRRDMKLARRLLRAINEEFPNRVLLKARPIFPGEPWADRPLVRMAHPAATHDRTRDLLVWVYPGEIVLGRGGRDGWHHHCCNSDGDAIEDALDWMRDILEDRVTQSAHQTNGIISLKKEDDVASTTVTFRK